jgi:hypothetical protein
MLLAPLLAATVSATAATLTRDGAPQDATASTGRRISR